MPDCFKDVAIVGAGIAGLYCAWRLVQSGIPSDRIGIYDAADRQGGRILTATWPRDGSIRFETGAHYLSTAHRLAMGLADQLGLSTSSADAVRSETLVYLRGKCLSDSEIRRSYLRKPFAYSLDRGSQRRNPRRLLEMALKRVNSATHDNAGAFRSPGLDGLSLGDIMEETLGPDGLEFLCDRIGYSFAKAPVDAGTTLTWLLQELFGGHFVTLAGGMSGFVDALTTALAEREVEVLTGHRLVKAETEIGAPSILRFETENDGLLSVEAGRVILALPPKGVEQIAGLRDCAAIRDLLASVIAWPIFTAAVIYPRQWWRVPGSSFGRVITDLPIGQVGFPGSAEKDGPGVVTIYSEGEKGRSWQQWTDGAEEMQWLGADSPILAEIHRQLSLIADLRCNGDIPPPMDIRIQDWQASPSGAGLHLWSSGTRPEELADLALQPLPDVGLHICGEAWSLRQGWIEGALETSEAVLRRFF